MATWTSGGSERYNRGAFACGLDSMPAVACNNPQSFSQLCAGPHSFHAAALDYAANVDPTPVNAAIQVTTGTACAAPTVSPSSSVVTTATGALLFIPYDDKGAGGRLHVEYGPTTAYGMEVADTRIEPGPATTTQTVGPVHGPEHAHPLQGDDHDPLRERPHRRSDPDHETAPKAPCRRSRTAPRR